MPVLDASVSQLEVTMWDSRPGNAAFLGECILNLSKLVPYAGNIIEQDFAVKQGKHFKTAVPASGKLMLQIELSTSPLPEGVQWEAEPADAVQGVAPHPPGAVHPQASPSQQ